MALKKYQTHVKVYILSSTDEKYKNATIEFKLIGHQLTMKSVDKLNLPKS